MSPARGPWMPGWLTRLAPGLHREEWIGDLVEQWHRERDEGAGPWASTARLWLRLLLSVVEARRTERALGIDTGGGRGRMGFGIAQDLRIAMRLLRREPTAAGAAFGTLALGVWAFLVGFALVDGALLEPLGYEDEERLAVIGYEGALYGNSMPNHVELVEDHDAFEAASVWQGWSVLLRPEDGPWSRVSAAAVTSGHFRMLGAAPALGRLFTPSDDLAGHEPVVVLSHAAWQTRFGGRADVLGSVVEADGSAYTVVGVVEAGFRDPIPRLLGWNEPELWRASPPEFEAFRDARGQVSFWSLGRVRSSVPMEAASSDVRARSAEVLGVAPAEVDIQVFPYADLVERSSRSSLVLLLGAGLVVLLVSAANVVNLLLARGTGRAQEMAIRSALGADRSRLLRQLLVEGAVLGLMAAIVGVVLTAATLRPVHALAIQLLPSGTEVTVTPAVLGAAVVVAVVAGILAALLPALGATRSSHLAGLRQGARGAARRTRLQTGLIITQTALAVVLVTGSGLLLRTVWALMDEDLGFDAAAVTAVPVPLYDELFGDSEDQSATLSRLLERFASVPGVDGAAAITDLPMSGRVNSTAVRRPDQPEGSALAQLQTLVRAVVPGYFAVMDVPLLEGRLLEAGDRRGSPEVAVVNRTYAERHFPDGGPLGRTVFVRGVERTVVGIVGDATEFSLGGARDPVLYLTYDQEVQAWMRAAVSVVLRTEDEAPSREALAEAASEIDARIPVGAPFRLTTYVERDTAGHRFRALLATSLGLLAMALASVGLAGVTAYLVRRRTRELGVRVALGAGPRTIAATVLGDSGALTLIGIGLGVAIAVPAGRVLSGFLYEVPPIDPVSISVAVLTLALSSLVAALVPTRRALRIAPVDALREE